ncbi:hypothetical protein [Ponticoccus sp. (in: a-proteobacteria)]|uniref:hypothetical protein n=1 Tax=Ponticoccus sp. (in: a-proteobacteria) TaxID=1925025 RepID=UPI003AB20CC8
MKKLLMMSSALLLSSGVAFAQTQTGTGADPTQSSATSGTAAVADQDTSSFGNYAEALDTAGGGLDETADAYVGSGADAAQAAVNAYGLSAGSGSFTAAVGVTSQAANANVQFQVGNNNQAVNVQVGSGQESATVQQGNDNNALISQTTASNEAAIMQLGDMNDTAIVQQGVDNGAASATSGNENTSLILQSGNDNIAANGQFGDRNTAVTVQSNGDNTAANLQIGDDNNSFISQGGGTSGTLAAIDGTTRSYGLPAGVSLITSPGSGPGSFNSAASVQYGSNNTSAIVQLGSSNEAVNYQQN